MQSTADVIGYGGQAGGGKTDLSIGLSVLEHHRAMIFRRYYTDLKDIVKRAKEITEGFRTGFNGSDFSIALPGGSSLEFGAMPQPDDWARFKGRAKDIMCFDEATEFLETQIRSVTAWVRSARKGQRKRVILTFNPPTDEEGKWVVRFFAPWLDEEHPNRAMPGEVRWFAVVDGNDVERPDGKEFHHTLPDGTQELIYPQSRTFIPAKLSDNPLLDSSGEYRRQLMNTPEPLRSQLLYGKFNIKAIPNRWQIIPTDWVQLAQQRWKERVGELGEEALLKELEATVIPKLAADVAHGGEDKTVIARLFDDFVPHLDKYKGVETPDGKSAAAFVFLRWVMGALTNVDGIGYGASCAEKLSDSKEDGGYGLDGVTAVNVGKPSEYTDRSGKYRMRNLRTEMFWRLRELLDPEFGATLCLPPDRELLADLCAVRYRVLPGGVFAAESKDDIKKRIKRSTDCGDAVALLTLLFHADWSAAAALYEEMAAGISAARETTGDWSRSDGASAVDMLATSW